MTKDKYLLTLKIAAIITAILDIAFVAFFIVKYALLWTGVIFVKGYLTDIALAALIVNAAFLCVLAVYLILRKK